MTFEEWIGDRLETMSSHEYAAEKAAWDAAWHEAFIQGYNEGYSDGESTPEGYVLVPVEPTDVMQQAGYSAVLFAPADTLNLATVCYKAMIEAAQEEE